MSLKIKETDWGIACRIGDTIYSNKNLKKYPELYKAILKHEKAHTSGLHYKDFWLDLKGKYIRPVKKQYYQFILKHPKSLVTFLPVWIYDKVIAIDLFQLFFWILAFIMIRIIINLK